MPGKISISMLGRYGAALFLAALVAGCSSMGSGHSSGPGVSDRGGNECQRNRNSCLYEGSYEQGERNYAEQEAKRLNQASLEKLRHNRSR